ncbi:MAG: hypothetical protein AABP62_16020 [Planctomycetota bacterium]
MTCNDRDCLPIQPVSPAIASPTEDPINRLDASLALPPVVTLSPSLHGNSVHAGQCPKTMGPPPDLIVLFQRWLI